MKLYLQMIKIGNGCKHAYKRVGLSRVLLSLFFLAVVCGYSYYTLEQFETLKFSIFVFGAGLLWFFVVPVMAERPWSDTQLAAKVFFGALIGFWVWSGIATLSSVDPLNSFIGVNYRFTNSWLFMTAWCLFTACLSVLSYSRFILYLVKVAIFSGLIVAMWAILQSLGVGYFEYDNSKFFRAPGFLGNANFTSLYIACLLPLTVIMAFYSRQKWERLYYWTSSIVSSGMLVMLASRGALLGLVSGWACLVLLSLLYIPNIRKTLLALSFIALVFGAIFSANIIGTDSPLRGVSSEDKNIQTRFFVWDLAISAAESYPLVGVGLGNFQYWYESGRGKNFASESSLFDDAHNIFLHLAATGGVPLAVMFIVCLLSAFTAAIFRVRNELDLISAAAAASIVVWVVAASFTPVSVPNFMLLALLLALSLRLPELRQEIVTKSRLSVGILAIRFSGAILAIAALVYIVSEVMLFSAMQMYWQGNYIKAFKQSQFAYWLNPTDQLMSVFSTASAIMLNESADKIDRLQSQAALKHPFLSQTYLQQAHLNMLRYQQTKTLFYAQQVQYNLVSSLAFNPYSHTGRYYLAQYYFLKNQMPAAKKMVESILILNPEHGDAWKLLARVYQEEGRREQFLYALSQAYKFQPSSVEIWKALRVTQGSGNIKDAELNINLMLGNL